MKTFAIALLSYFSTCVCATAGAFAFNAVGPPALGSALVRTRPTSETCSILRLGCTAQPTAWEKVALRALPATFKTLWGSKVGASFRDVAVVKEVPMSGPREGEVLVQVAYAGVNGGCETFRSRGEHWFADNREKQAGFALGAEGVGLVAAVGPGVDGLAVGDAVSFVGGAFAEYVIAAAARCSRIRSATPEAAAARISGSTAMGAVLSMGEAKRGQVVLVTAGAGAAGSFAVQIAKHLGCKVVATCGSAAKAQILCSLGCDTIINYRTRDLDAALSKAYPQGVDLVVEHVGGDMFRTALRHLKDDGRLILVGYISEYPHTNAYASGHTAVPSESLGSAAAHDATTTQAFDLADIFWNQRVVEVAGTHKTIYGKLYPSMEAAGAARVQLQQLLDEGNIKALVDARQFVGVDEVADAVDYMLSGAALGKVVVRMMP